MHAVYGVPPDDLVAVPAGAVQVSALVPGSADLAACADASLDGATIYAPRGTRERRFVIAQALRCLRVGARFTLLAPKNQGGSRLMGDLEAFGCTAVEEARRHHRICRGVRPAAPLGIADALTDGALQFSESLGLWSQPGTFSWDRVDAGSAMLIEYLPALRGRGADLGCGIGVLSRAVLLQPEVQHITALDVDRRAVAAARRNLDPERATVVWADMADAVAGPMDLDFVIMNPPFHDGGVEDQTLGRRFIARAAAILSPSGTCVLVANRHLPYEGGLRELFRDVQRPIQADGYKVYVARR
jgi:16S rRNA (guanine1207-N2)-methyltransferase